jgi:hypothetical protein
MPCYYFFNFLCNSYSDEFITVDPHEYDEVQRLMAEEDSGWSAYNEWASLLEPTEQAAALEQYAFERHQEQISTININGAPILINRDCNHSDCKSSRCSREVRLAGIAI